MAELEKAAAAQAAETTAEASLLDQIVEQGRFADPAARERGKNLVKEFVEQVLEGSVTLGRDVDQMITQRVAQIDHLISLQLNEVIHHPSLPEARGHVAGSEVLDGSVRNQHHAQNPRAERLEEGIAPRSAKGRGIRSKSAMFKKVYEDEFGIFGGEPYGALIGDYEFSKHPEDMELLEKASQVAAGAHAPFLSAASPELLNMPSFTGLDQPRDIAKIFDSTEYAKWKAFRQSEDSKYVCLTCPRILMRLPYGAATKPVEGFNFEEGVDGTDHTKYLWGNAAYALGARMTQAFAQYAWCTAIRGVEGGGLVEGLPAHTFHTDEGDVALKCPTEIAITDRREKELADQGLVPLVHCKGTDKAAFFSIQSCNKPKVYDSDAATANARISAQLPYMMATCRFAHYLKSMMRDKIGSFLSRDDCWRFLNRWISQYVTQDDNADQATKAQYPLREARVDVEEIKGKPGCYRAITYLRPHFQLDELSVSLRLVADLPAPAKK